MTGDGETQEDADSFIFERQMEPQSYFLHVGAPEFAPHQALSERLYSVAEDFEAEDSSQLSGEPPPNIEIWPGTPELAVGLSGLRLSAQRTLAHSAPW